MQYSFQQDHLHHISSAPASSSCLPFLVCGFNTGASKPTTDISAATSLPNL